LKKQQQQKQLLFSIELGQKQREEKHVHPRFKHVRMHRFILQF